jgi:hypothetical protein
VIDGVDKQALHHSFFLDNGRFREIELPGAPTGTLATDINDRGHIVGWIL